MVKASLRTASSDKQITAALTAATAPAVAAQPQRTAIPARPVTSAPVAAAIVAAPVRMAATAAVPRPAQPLAARPVAAKPAVSTAAVAKIVQPPETPVAAPVAAAPATPAQPTRKLSVRRPAATQPPIEVEATVVTEVAQVATPDPAVAVESVTTIAAPVAENTAAISAAVLSQDEIDFKAGHSAARNNEPVPAAYSEKWAEGYNAAIAQLTATPQVEAPVAEPEASTAMVVRPPSAVRRVTYADGESFVGDWGQEDLRFPTLKLVQGSGPLSKQFNDGTILYADLELLPPPSIQAGGISQEIRFAPLQIVKQFREKISDEESKSGVIPRVANSIAEVEEMGGTTQWGPDSTPVANYWGPSGKCLLLLEQPEGIDHPGFVVDLDGKLYGVAVYYAGGGAYRHSAKIILNTSLTSLMVPVTDEKGQPKKDPQGRVLKKPMPYKNFWSMTFQKDTSGKSQFSPWQPRVKLLAKESTGPELRAYCENLIAGNSAESAAADQD